MLKKFETDMGKIFCKYNEDTDDFTIMKVCWITKNDDQKNVYFCRYLDKDFKFDDSDDVYHKYFSEEEFSDIRKNWTSLKSEGIIAITNIVAVKSDHGNIRDVLVIYYPNNPITQVPDIKQPYIVARQGVTNIFAEMAGINVSGMSVSIDTLPIGYALSDFMINESVISSHLTNVYKTDTPEMIETCLLNKESTDILEDLYDHAIRYKKNTIDGYQHESKENDCVDGYSNSILAFLKNSDFIGDLNIKMNIVPVDFEIEEGKELDLDEKLLLCTLCGGGIRMLKAVPLKFDYSINFNMIKMKYVLVKDCNDILYIVPYTESPEEITPEELYNLTEERTIKLQERLAKCVKAYDQSKGIKSDFASEMIPTEK